MTVHQSKGREFDAVVLFDASAESFRWNAEESIRLFYVAITRARRHWEIIAKRGNVTTRRSAWDGLAARSAQGVEVGYSAQAEPANPS